MSLKIRGLHLDPARRQLTSETVIDIIKKVKQYDINTIHLHLTDDQGIAFSSDILNYQKGWSKNEMINISNEAKKLNIQIILEIDIPGHSYCLRSLLENGKYDHKEQMGIISDGLLRLEDMNKIFNIFEELCEIFESKYIHIGCDETRGGDKIYFQTIIKSACEWAEKKGLNVIAWEDILNKLDEKTIPKNLYIQKWKHRTFSPIAKNLEFIGNNRIIYSNNYYLDTSIDPFTAYRAKIPENALGCIACTWGELIGEENIYHCIFPTIKILAHKWNNIKTNDNPLFLLKDELKNNYGGDQNSWKRRQWRPFVLKKEFDIPQRSTSSVTKSTILNREEDTYPIISNFLINFGIDLYNYIFNNQIPENIKEYNNKLKESGVSDKILNLMWISNNDIDQKKKILRKIRSETENEEQLLYKNGFRMIIREVLREK